MRLLVFLVFTSVAGLVSCRSIREAQFPVNILQADLEAIDKYYDRIDKPVAYISWPLGIIFKVQPIHTIDGRHLRIDGTFKVRTFKQLYLVRTRVNIVYKNGQFYTENVVGKRKPLSPSAKVYYQLPVSYEIYTPCLLIQYASYYSLKVAHEAYFNENKFFLKTYRRYQPSTHLQCFGDERQQLFLEFNTFEEEGTNTAKPDGGVRVLIGQWVNDKIIVSRNATYDRLVFRRTEQGFGVPEGDTVLPPYVRNVFGIRMATVGFLAEMKKDSVKLLSADDIAFGGDKKLEKHEVFMHELLWQSLQVEPKNCLDDDPGCLRSRPESGGFQVHGHILVKKVNFKDEKDLSRKDCPYIIEYATPGPDFIYKEKPTQQFCSNNIDKLWAQDEKPNVYQPNEPVTLMYPKFDIVKATENV